MIPANRSVPWGTLWEAGRKGKTTLPGGQIAKTIRCVMAGGALLRLDDGVIFEPEQPATIEALENGKPIGVYVLVYDKRGRQTEGEILRLQDLARLRPGSGERP